MSDADRQIIIITLKYGLPYVLFKGPWGKEGEVTRSERDGLDVSKKESIFEIEKMLQKKRVQKTMHSETGRLLSGPHP